MNHPSLWIGVFGNLLNAFANFQRKFYAFFVEKFLGTCWAHSRIMFLLSLQISNSTVGLVLMENKMEKGSCWKLQLWRKHIKWQKWWSSYDTAWTKPTCGTEIDWKRKRKKRAVEKKENITNNKDEDHMTLHELDPPVGLGLMDIISKWTWIAHLRHANGLAKRNNDDF